MGLMKLLDNRADLKSRTFDAKLALQEKGRASLLIELNYVCTVPKTIGRRNIQE